ncbi:MAG TPA: adenylate/guanylate cyclase domain-containing protein [Candidatus Limnocylindria bacterium]|jgi:class 3 adenylate cyclase|nr:adenylate/guanylate cyclase domain-containing protein [Candidatus Limnocylindria bacterium]
MPELSAKRRAALPDSAFAHIDSKGRRRLPIHDAAHVRNALARFNQVVFESAETRDRARLRLLNAAKRHGIVPVGFMTGQLRSERYEAEKLAIENDRLLGQVAARSGEVHELPTGQVTFLLADIEGSTLLVGRLGDRYAELLAQVRRIIRRIVRQRSGFEVDVRADEFFAVFASPVDALASAVAVQRGFGSQAWIDGLDVRVRIGLHSGEPTLTETGYVGLAVHTAARICSAGHGGQIVLSRATRDVLGAPADGVSLRSLGAHRLHGLPEPEELFQVLAADLLDGFPPPRTLELVVG